MTPEYSHRFSPWHTASAEAMFLDGEIATIEDDDGTLVGTVVRRVEPIATGAGPEDRCTIVDVGGDIDHDMAPLLQLALSQALDGRTTVCCDLSNVTFFGAAGANTLLAAHRRATELGCAFFLRGVYGIIERVLAIVDPDKIVPRQQ
jgi:anti-anti-sigma factor